MTGPEIVLAVLTAAAAAGVLGADLADRKNPGGSPLPLLAAVAVAGWAVTGWLWLLIFRAVS